MNRNIIFIALILIAAGTGYLFLSPDRTLERDQAARHTGAGRYPVGPDRTLKRDQAARHTGAGRYPVGPDRTLKRDQAARHTGAGRYPVGPDRTLKRDQAAQVDAKSQEEAPPVEQAPGQDLSADKKRRARMRAEYAELELARDGIRRQLGKLRSRLWKLQVPPDQARAITEQMQRGYAALKNPPMLGAFFSVGDISKETNRIKEIGNKLTALEITVQEHITAQETD